MTDWRCGGSSASTTCRSVRQTPQARTRISTSPAWGRGRAVSSLCTMPRGSSARRTAAITTLRCLNADVFEQLAFGLGNHRPDEDDGYDAQCGIDPERQRPAELVNHRQKELRHQEVSYPVCQRGYRHS